MTHPVWTLYTRRLGQRLGYWVSALGYNWRDQSTANRLYLGYFLLFWAVWAVAAFSLVGGWIAGLLGLAGDASAPPLIALGLAQLGLAGWGLLSLWRAGRRSPFIFTEEDAHLVAQTPVSRPAVALALFLLNWYEAAAPFAVATVAICFGVVQARFPGEFDPAQIVDVLRYTGQALSVVLPLHLALQAAAWAVGALRLRGQSASPAWGWAAPALLALLALTPALLSSAAAPLDRVLLQPWLWPLRAALSPAFLGGGSWLLAVALALLAAGLSVAALVAAAQRLSFNRAAQETALQATIQAAQRFGQNDLAQTLRLRQRLGAGRKPSPWLARPGAWSLLAKALLQTRRSLGMGWLVQWLYIGGLTVGVLSAPSAVVQLLVGALWVLAVSSATTARLRSDLANWWLLRQLPVPAQQLFVAELALPWALTVLAAEAAVVLTPALGLGARLAVGAVLPLLAAGVAFAAGADVLRQAKVRTLMVPALATENVPAPGLWGLLQGVASAAASLGLLYLSLAQPAAALWVPLALGAAGFIALFNLASLLSAYRWID